MRRRNTYPASVSPDSRRMQTGFGLARLRLQAEVAVDVAARPDHSDRNHLLVVIHGVDDPVITDPDPQPRPVTLQRAGARGPGIIGECAHRG
jgi:hypothetical protein